MYVDSVGHEDWGHACATEVSLQSPRQSLPCHGLCSVTTSEFVCMYFEIKGNDSHFVLSRREASELCVEWDQES